MVKGIFIVLAITGSLLSICKNAVAEERTMSKGIFTVPTMHASHKLQRMFSNIQQAQPKITPEQYTASWKSYKALLKGLVAVDFSDSVQLGLDSIKVQQLDPKDCDILDINLHMQGRPSTDSITARGYGVELRIKLD
jgi:hypothetical protein